jgi:hypothetical protein
MTPPSTAARLARQAERLEAAMTAAITQVISAVPALDADHARSALEAAVPITIKGPARFLEELAAHMAAHPDALVSGDSHCPPVVLRLTHVLNEAGHPVVRPGCAHCRKLTPELRQLRPQGRVCGTCDGRSRRSTCARCGQEGVRIAVRKPEGKICYRCYGHDPETFKECARCGRMDKPVSRLDDGSVLCKRCWQRPEHRCVHCGNTKPAALIDDEGALLLPVLQQVSSRPPDLRALWTRADHFRQRGR